MLLTNFHAVRITLFDVNAVDAFTGKAIGRAIPPFQYALKVQDVLEPSNRSYYCFQGSFTTPPVS